MEIKLVLPQAKRGRRSIEGTTLYYTQLGELAKVLIILSKKIGKKVSARDWCYLLEGYNIIDKSEFDLCEKYIIICRKEGFLPIDFTAKDDTRKFYNTGDFDIEYEDPDIYIENVLINILNIEEEKKDIIFWDFQEYYIQMMVEKVDIRNLFYEICRACHIPIANAKGWSDLNCRNDLAQNFKIAEDRGLKPVLLYYGDLDPAGLKIAETLRKNLKAIEKATKWNPNNLIIERFGLNIDFIEKNNLTWIDNLITGSGKNLADPRHPDHNKPYVQDYIRKYGIRKCEATAILPIGDIAKTDCAITIINYLGKNCFDEYNKRLEEIKNEVIEVMGPINYKTTIQTLIDNIKKNNSNQD